MLKTLPLLSRFSSLSFHMMKKVTNGTCVIEEGRIIHITCKYALGNTFVKLFLSDKISNIHRIKKKILY